MFGMILPISPPIHPLKETFVLIVSKYIIDLFILLIYIFRRPESVCFCFDIEPITNLKNHLIILQHPNELKRCLRTTKILELSIPTTNYHLFNGKRFNTKKFPKLYELINERKTILLYPSPSAEPLDTIEVPEETGSGFNIIILDGTWSQARVLYNTNSFLHSLRCFKLNSTRPSQYVIRTQPTEICLSTVEAAAMILTHMESNLTIYDRLTRPLKTICDYQLDKGAVRHQSKEYLITNGLYTKPLNKKILKKLDNQHQKNNSLSEIKDLVHLLDR